MGLFNREPAEKTAYKKALSSMISKPNEKTFAAMEEASKAWQGGWHGYWYMGLAYGMASGVPYSPERAQQCRQLAMTEAKKAGGKSFEWLELFYYVFDEDAGNFFVEGEYFPRAMFIRKVVASMLRNFDASEAVIAPDYGIRRDMKFWMPLFKNVDTGGFFKSSDEQYQCYYQVNAIKRLLKAYDESKMENRQGALAVSQETWNDFVKEKKVTPRSNDLENLALGWTLLIGGGPYAEVIATVGSGWHQNLRIDGWVRLASCANKGNMTALHLLCGMFDGEFKDEICYAYKISFKNKDTEEKVRNYMLFLLDKSSERGDKNAAEYADMLVH